ncbi:MAG TPA: sugar phosphate isomerase/epimerase [bacterium]|nr:sugar phosphate isomerase/epimerase [bacterium]HPN45648.1 sugar phosphate isomerase/epimerase [bacterium]
MNKQTISRRVFTKSLLTAGAAMGLGSVALKGCAKPAVSQETPVGIQLYTVRDLLQTDFTGTLRQVAAIGYKALEFAGFGYLTAAELKALLTELGVQTCGAHIGIEQLDANLNGTLEYNLELGNPNIICPYMPNTYQDQKADGFKAFAEKLNLYGESIKKAGMQFIYHNHAFEFEKVDDKYLYDILMENTQPELVKLEADLYWVKRAGIEPLDYIKTYSSRLTMIHMKDMANDAEQSFAPVGTGVMDFPPIILAARELGIKWFVVEQDRCTGSPIEAITTSYTNMKALLKA